MCCGQQDHRFSKASALERLSWHIFTHSVAMVVMFGFWPAPPDPCLPLWPHPVRFPFCPHCGPLSPTLKWEACSWSPFLHSLLVKSSFLALKSHSRLTSFESILWPQDRSQTQRTHVLGWNQSCPPFIRTLGAVSVVSFFLGWQRRVGNLTRMRWKAWQRPSCLGWH